MLDYIKNESKDFVDFKLSINTDFLTDEDKKVDLIKNILRSITLIPDSLKQEVYIKKLSSVLEIDEASLFRSFANIETNKSLKKSSRKLYKNKISKVQNSYNENTSSYIYQLERQIISDDHRMAMSFAPLSMINPIIIINPEVVSKSYLNFWNDLESLGFKISQK